MFWLRLIFSLFCFQIHFSSFTCPLAACATQLSVNDSRQLKQSTAFSKRCRESISFTRLIEFRRVARYTVVVAELMWASAKSIFFWLLKLESNKWPTHVEKESPPKLYTDRSSRMQTYGQVIVCNQRRRNCTKMKKEIQIGHTTHSQPFSSLRSGVAVHFFWWLFLFRLFCFVVAIELQSFFVCCVRNPSQGSSHCFYQTLFTFFLSMIGAAIWILIGSEWTY